MNNDCQDCSPTTSTITTNLLFKKIAKTFIGFIMFCGMIGLVGVVNIGTYYIGRFLGVKIFHAPEPQGIEKFFASIYGDVLLITIYFISYKCKFIFSWFENLGSKLIK